MTKLILIALMTFELTATFDAAGVMRNVPPGARLEYARYIAEAATKHKVDPMLISAVIWTESNFTNLPRNASRDFGLMQVHWQPAEPWLKGLTRADLMKPRINIHAGVAELAHMRAFCRRWKHRGHGWWIHYLDGPRVKHRWYERRVARWRAYFARIRARLRARKELL